MKWWKDIFAAIGRFFSKKAKPVVVSDEKPPVVIPTPEPIPVSEPSAQWPSYRCDKFFYHGFSSEDDMREAALDEAKKLGLDCIRCLGTNMNDEVAVHILHYKSPKDDEFKLGKKNWYNKALEHGVKRWQIQVTLDIAEKWQKFVVDYPMDSVQFLAVDVSTVKKIITTRPVLQA